MTQTFEIENIENLSTRRNNRNNPEQLLFLSNSLKIIMDILSRNKETINTIKY